MTLMPGSKTSNERLIFVKNVPAYVPKEQIAKLFAPYNPIRSQDIYKSSITTYIIEFRSMSDAARAQRETDGKSLGNAVIKVEMYEQERSLRYLKAHGYANPPPPEDGDQEGKDQSKRPHQGFAPKEALDHFPPLYPVPVRTPKTIPQSTTWARIASKQHARGLSNAPAMTQANSSQTPISTPVATLRIATPRMPLTLPLKSLAVVSPQSAPAPTSALDSSSSAAAAAAVSPSNVAIPSSVLFLPSPPSSSLSQQPSSADATPSPETEVEYQIRRWGEILGWAQNASSSSDVLHEMQQQQERPMEPLDTTERIRQRHVLECGFCVKREEVRNAWRDGLLRM